MILRVCPLLFALFLAMPSALFSESPDPKEIVDGMITAAGGEAFSQLGVLRLEVHEEQTRNDGVQTTKDYTLMVDTANLANLRIEYPNGTVVGANAASGWGVENGVQDDRIQTPVMARKILNQTAFPLLMPYSLKMDGVWVEAVRESTLDGRDVWVLAIPFSKGFFVSPVLTTTWFMVVAQDDYSILAFEFVPPVEYRKVSPVGIRYRILKTQEVEGAKITEQVLSVGINDQGHESGLVRVTKSKASTRHWEPSLFLSPAQLEALEEEE
jgi:hypothetical protein